MKQYILTGLVFCLAYPCMGQAGNSNTSMEFLQKCMMDPEPVVIRKMGDSVNLGSSSNYAPFVTADELTLFFTSSRREPYDAAKAGKGIENSFAAHRASLSSPWKIDYLSKAMDSRNHDAIAGISLDGARLFIRKGDNNIYVLDRGEWSKVKYKSIKEYYGIKLKRKYHISSCAMSADEKTFYITADMPKGLGGHDVWKTTRKDKGWTPWVNLGPTVNTAGEEMTVSLQESSIFVASDGRLGFGGFDLYRFDPVNDSNYEVVHLGYPVNTINNDLYYCAVSGNPSHAYYSTERSAGSNVYDIYSIDYEDKILSERNKIMKRKEDERKRAADSALLARNKQREQDSIAAAVAAAALDEAKRREAELRNAALQREKELLAEQQRIKREAAEREAALREEQRRREEDLAKQYDEALSKKGYTDLQSIENPTKGMKIYLNNIVFEQGKSTLLSSSYGELDKVLEFLKRFPDVRIEVGGHTSSEGGYNLNQRLSEERARSVRDYIIRRGIESNRISYHGYNYSMPIEDERTETGRMLNRRVEFIVL